MLPSVKTIKNRLGVSLEAAKGIWGAMEGRVLMPKDSPLYKHHHNPPTKHERQLDMINALLDGHGVEVIRGDWVSNFYGDINAEYINMGDPYINTILYDTLEDRWHVISYGDFIEEQERRGREFP